MTRWYGRSMIDGVDSVETRGHIEYKVQERKYSTVQTRVTKPKSRLITCVEVK